jgi:large subunit ribosomal protein L3
MGNETKTSKTLRVVRIDTDENLLLVCGAVPGPAGAYIYIRRAKKQKRAARPAAEGKAKPAKK